MLVCLFPFRSHFWSGSLGCSSQLKETSLLCVFKAYRTQNDVEVFLTGEIEYKMYCDQQMQSEGIFINAANSRRIFAFRSK